jgi:hypothetical protein
MVVKLVYMPELKHHYIISKIFVFCSEPSNYAEPDEQKNDLNKKLTWEKEMALSTFLTSHVVS